MPSDTSNPLMNAARGAGQESAGDATGPVRHSQGPAQRAENVMHDSNRHMAARKSRHHVVLVARGHGASDYRNAECATDLKGYGVGRRTNPRVASGDRAHDGVRRCR